MAKEVGYSGGNKALSFRDDGTGFAYYPNGKIALAVAPQSDYQVVSFAYDKDKANTLLVAVDALGIGYVQSAAREQKNVSLTLTEKGGLLCRGGSITREWQWAHAKNQPTEPIQIHVSEHLRFVYEGKSKMTLFFDFEGIRHELDCSVKQKRKEPDYMSTARKDLTGKLHPASLDSAKSLKERTEDFNKLMLAKHNLVHPKSVNLSEMVSPIVANLEGMFDDIGQRMKTDPSPGTTWKGEALTSTITELPKIPLMGTETGKFTGFGEKIYTDESPEMMRTTKKLPNHLVDHKGNWKNDTAVHEELLALNPVLKRTNVLKCNSGRYSRLATIDPNNVTHSNPTGMVVPIGDPISTLKWKDLKEENRLAASTAGTELTVAVVGRVGQPDYMALLRIADFVNLQMKDMPEMTGVRVVRVDAGEDTSIIREMNLKYLPTFLAFKKGNCIYSGQFGGQKVQSFALSASPKVLIVEPNFKRQMAMEKTLKKMNCDVFLCLSAGEALLRLRVLTRPGSGQVIPDIVLISHELGVSQAQDLGALGKQLEQFTSIRRTVVAATVDVLGAQGHANIKATTWSKSASSNEVGALLQQPLVNYAKILIQKPIKQKSIEELISMRKLSDGGAYLGMTPENFILKLKELKERVPVASAEPELMRLTVEDTHIGGPDGRTLC